MYLSSACRPRAHADRAPNRARLAAVAFSFAFFGLCFSGVAPASAATGNVVTAQSASLPSPLDSGALATASTAANPAAILYKGPPGGKLDITAGDLEAEAAQRVPPDARKLVLGKAANVEGQSKNLYVRRALANEAVLSGLAADPKVEAEVRLARDRVLSDARLAQIDAANRPSEAALTAFARSQYDANPKAFATPERVHARHILISSATPDARKVAEDLLAQLKNGADFATLAKEKSDDPGSAARGGDLGTLESGRTVPPFDAAMFALTKPGELSPVVETSFGFHIIQLIARLPAGAKPFSEVKDTLMKQAATTIAQEARTREATRLLKDAMPEQPAIEAFAAEHQ